jgi:L-cysteine/cystine lyase
MGMGDLNGLQQLRQHLPALKDKVYFNYGGQGPLPQAALVSIMAAHQKIQQEGPFSGAVNGWMQAEGQLTREVMAEALGVTPATVTLTEDVTVGCNIPLWGISWQPGDHVLLSDCEHPGVIAAVNELSRRFGLEISYFPLLPHWNTADPVAAIAAALRPTTRLLVISHVLWNTGQVLPLGSIVDLCHQHTPQPVWVLVDAAQSVGMLPLNLSQLGVDFYAFTGHKWWCGPAGLGGLYVRAAVREAVSPTFIGWRGIQVDGQAQPVGWQPDGRRYEVATSDVALCAGLRDAIAAHQQWGTAEQRYSRIGQLSQYLWEKLQRLQSVTCLLTAPPQSGLISFQITPGGQPAPELHVKLVKALETQHIYLRTLLSPHCVRACTHYFTLESEIDQLVEVIDRFLTEALS